MKSTIEIVDAFQKACSTVTRIETNSSAVETLVNDFFGLDGAYCLQAEEECNSDDIKEYVVDPSDLCESSRAGVFKAAKDKTLGKGAFIPVCDVLNYIAKEGIITKGTYIVNVY